MYLLNHSLTYPFHTFNSGFTISDGIPLLQSGLPFFCRYIEEGGFKLMGYASGRITETLEKEKFLPDGEVPIHIREELARYELPLTHVKNTIFAIKISYKKKINHIPGH